MALYFNTMCKLHAITNMDTVTGRERLRIMRINCGVGGKEREPIALQRQLNKKNGS